MICSLSRETETLHFRFALVSEPLQQGQGLEDVVIPALQSEAKRARKDELWKHTCLELFVSTPENERYLEMNLSPSGDWNLYEFTRYREGMSPVMVASPPSLEVTQHEPKISWDWQGALHLPADSSFARAASLVIGATCVLEYTGGEREYWALCHAGEKPDFHLRKSFVIQI